jgi:hypothetical protein
VRAKPKAPKRIQRRRPNKKPAFLDAYKNCANLTAAAAAVGINRSIHYDWLRKDAKYRAAFDLADIEATQTLYDSAVQRALVGVYEPNVYQGQFIYPREEYVLTPAVPAVEAVEALDWKDEGGPRAAVAAVPAIPEVRAWRDVPGAPPLGIWKRSESLHLALLRAKIPAFRAASVEMTGKDGGAIEISLAEVLRERRAKREADAEKS